MPIYAGNWKMNMTAGEAVAFMKDFLSDFSPNNKHSVIIFPPAVHLPILRKLAGDRIKLGCQNIYYEEKGAFTGETSILMVKDYTEYVLVGHSERRRIFGESIEDTEKKLALVLKHGLVPVLCVGETLEERNSGIHKETVMQQLKAVLSNIEQYTGEVIIAYEPVWAIGTGRTASPEDAQEMHAFIKSIVPNARVLYGGSVKPDNAASLIAKPDIDGLLIGGASINPESFLQIIKTREE